MGNPIDSIVGFFNPVSGLKRAQSRAAMQIVKRSYDATMQGGKNSNWYRPRTSGKDEVSRASDKLAASGQELCRNNPLAHRIKMIWAANIVGAGIKPEITVKPRNRTKRITTSFDDWAESTHCDFEGHYDFYGLQWLWAATIVESGGVFVRKHINTAMKVPLQLQTIEQTLLDKSKTSRDADGDSEILDGVQYNSIGQIEGYWILNHEKSTQSSFHKKDTEIVHLFRKERAGEHLGVSWLTQSATTLNHYGTLVEAKLMQAQILSCLAIFIENPTSNIAFGSPTGDPIDSVEPGMIENVEAGTKIHSVTPPSNTDSGIFGKEIKDDIAIGAGLAGTQLTGDYSKLNFASGRMSKIEFFQTLDYAQLQMMKPALDIIFSWFGTVMGLTGEMGVEIKADWTFPPRGVVQPGEELDVAIKKVRNGIMSPSKFAKTYGEKLERVIEQWKKDKLLFGDLPFDIDPSVYSPAGNQISDDDVAAGEATKDVESV